MSLSTQDFTLAWRRVGNYFPTLKPTIVQALQELKSSMAGLPVLPDLQVVPFDHLSSSEVVIANVACKLYAIVLLKESATATFSKLTDSATTSSDADSEFRFWQNAAGDQYILADPTGIAFANGITAQGNTTASGGTGSSTDGATGFALIGAA